MKKLFLFLLLIPFLSRAQQTFTTVRPGVAFTLSSAFVSGATDSVGSIWIGKDGNKFYWMYSGVQQNARFVKFADTTARLANYLNKNTATTQIVHPSVEFLQGAFIVSNSAGFDLTTASGTSFEAFLGASALKMKNNTSGTETDYQVNGITFKGLAGGFQQQFIPQASTFPQNSTIYWPNTGNAADTPAMKSDLRSSAVSTYLLGRSNTFTASTNTFTNTVNMGFLNVTGVGAAITGTTNVDILTINGASNVASRIQSGVGFSFYGASNTTHYDISNDEANLNILRSTSNTGGINVGSVNVVNTTGTGFVDLIEQSASPSSLSGHLRIYADSVDRLSWKNSIYRRTIKIGRASDQTVSMPFRLNTIVADSTDVATNYVPNTRTVAGFALSGNVTLATLTPGSTLTNSSGASTYNGSAASTFDLNLGHFNSWTNGIGTSGNITAAAWGATGINLNIAAATYTDNSSTGTVATQTGINTIGAPTINTTNSGVTYTNIATLVINGSPISGTNSPTFTNTYGLIVGGKTMLSGGFQTNATATSSNLVVPTSSSASTTNVAGLTFAGAPIVNFRAAMNGGNPTTIGTNNSYTNLLIGVANIVTPATGTNQLLANVVIKALGINTAGGSTLPETNTLRLEGRATGGVLNYTLRSIGLSRIDSLTSLRVLGTLSFNNPTAGTAGTDSVVVHNSAGQIKVISPTYYAPSTLIVGTPTIVAGTGAGTSPTVSVTSNGKGLQVTVTTGTLPTGTNATVATVTLANALSYTPNPVFSPASANTSLLSGASMIYMTSTGTANVTITSGTTALTAATTYVWNISL